MSDPQTTAGPTAETVQRPVRAPDTERAPSTTHAGYGEGNPRLALSHGGWAYDGEGQTIFTLDADVVTIGSGAEADIVLEGLAPVHAEIRHDDRDDYVLVLHGDGGAPTVAGGPDVDRPGPQALHHGASFSVGDWTLIFLRDEYADHGRPSGGREGGEGEVQPAQGERPSYRGEASAEGEQGDVGRQSRADGVEQPAVDQRGGGVDQVQGDLAKDEQAVGE